MTRPITAVLALAALLAGACSAMEMNDATGGINSCSSDADCRGDNGRCDQGLAACVSADGTMLQSVVLHVTDPQLGTTSEHKVDLPATGAGQPLDVQLAEPTLVRGTVSLGGAEEVVLAARLTLRRVSDVTKLPGTAVYADAESRVETDDGGREFNFQARLLPGDYQLEVEPTPGVDGDPAVRTHYPLFDEITIAAASGDDSERLDVTIPAATRRIASRVVDADGAPLAGVRVYAFDPASDRRVSSVAVTACDGGPDDEDCGRFEVAVATDLERFRLRLSGTDAQPMLPVIEAGEFRFSEIDLDEPRDRITTDELGELVFPAYEAPVLYQTIVEGVDRSGAIAPVSGATLELRSVVTPEHLPSDGVFELSATTDASGAVVALDDGRRGPEGIGIWLHPGEYDVTIVPPPEGELATGRSRITIESPMEGDDPMFERLTIGARVLLSGVVATPDGQPVPGAAIEAINEDGLSFSTVADETGGYALFVDSGFYEVRLVPPDGNLLSWTRQLNVAAFSDLDLDATVGWGTPFAGSVSDAASGEPVESALIEVYRVEQIPDSEELVLVPFARLRTTTGGGFTFVVPQEPPPE